MKSCEVYFKGPVAFVFTQCGVESGPSITTEPMLKVRGDDAAELGAAVMTCLAASRTGVPPPADYNSLAKDMIRFAGEKSWARFVKDAVLRGVWLDGKEGGTVARIVPYVPAERGSFAERAAESVTCRAEAGEIGRCLVESLGGAR